MHIPKPSEIPSAKSVAELMQDLMPEAVEAERKKQRDNRPTFTRQPHLTDRPFRAFKDQLTTIQKGEATR